MKRLFILFLTVTALLMVLPVSGVASASAPAVTVSSAEGTAGSTVSVTLSLSDNPGITAFRFKLNYDSEKLELTDAQFSALLGSPAAGGNLTANPYVISWFSPSSKDEAANGVFAELTFRIKEDVKPATTPLSISYSRLDVCNSRFEDVTLATVGGSITIFCEHQWDAFNIRCDKCGEKQLLGNMQQRLNGDTKDFRLLVETMEQTFADADAVILTLDFLDANHTPLREKPVSVSITTVYTQGVRAGDTIYKPAIKGYCIGGVIVQNIPVSAGVKYVVASATFVKGDVQITYELGTATLP